MEDGVFFVLGACFAAGVALLILIVLSLKARGHYYARSKRLGGTIGPGALFVCLVAGADFCFDVVALGELRGGLLDAGLACMGMSMAVNAVVICGVIRSGMRSKTPVSLP